MFGLRGAPVSLNQYALYEYPGGADAGYNTTTGRTTATPTITAQTGIFITLGQSLICSISDGASAGYTPTNTGKCFNLNPYDGIVYQTKDALLGCDANSSPAASWQGRLQDDLFNAAKYTQTIICPVGIGGTFAADWAPGGVQNHRLIVALLRCRQLGYTPNAILWMQGQADNNAGTSSASYQASLKGAIATSRGYGYNGKWLIALSTRNASGVTSSTIRAAQAAVCDGTTIIQGPDIDTNLSSSTNYGTGGLHFNDTGNANCASQWSTSIQTNL